MKTLKNIQDQDIHEMDLSSCWIWLNEERGINLEYWSWKLNKYEYMKHGRAPEAISDFEDILNGE